MKIFKVYENGDYKNRIIAADNIRKAIDLFEKATDMVPVKIKEITANGEQVIIQGLIEPEYDKNDIPF